jgi:acyl-[acyl-carrier-protein]-phospholipid O-acyltransferase/long-chain-fatty-acid--[acyl-carrier-protein] ligase
VQVFIQARPPDGMKGRMIAVMNQANFLAMMLGGPVYSVFSRVANEFGWPRSSIFAMLAALMLPVAVFYRLPSPAAGSPDAAQPAQT